MKTVFFFFACYSLSAMANGNITPMSLEGIAAIFSDKLAQGEILLPLILAFFAGFLTFLSPCIYPLIPITMSVIGVRRYQSYFQAFLTSFSYVSGMAILYTLLGAIFASVGILLGSTMQHPLIIAVVAGLFIVLALSMFGAFTLALPPNITTALSKIGGQGKIGAFFLGMVAGIIAAPCTGPVLTFILALIAGKKNLVLGSSLMLSFSFGLGMPFLLLGTFSSLLGRLPKSGRWMNTLKYALGAIMLGTAFYYILLLLNYFEVKFDIMTTLSIKIKLILLLLGIFLLTMKSNGLLYTFKTITGISCLALGITALIAGNVETTKAASANFYLINAASKPQELDQLLSNAQEERLPVLIDFYADWCIACKQLEEKTFKDPDVAAELKSFVLVRIDLTKNTDYLIQLQERFKVLGLPTIVFLNKLGTPFPDSRVMGFMKPKAFYDHLKKLLSENH